MAFFKFRWLRKEDDSSERPGRRARAPQGESIELLRRRARHRLIGAAFLVFLGVVGFPILFDTQPRSIPVDIPIEIPDRNKVAALASPAAIKPVEVGSTNTSAAGAKSSQESVAAGVTEGEEVVASGPSQPMNATSPVPVPVPIPSPVSKPPAAPPKVDVKPQQPPVVNPSQPEPAKPARIEKQDESSRARALLEGRGTNVPASSSVEEGRFIVQVGAFADADKAREVRQKLERSGLKTYTQVVDTKDGKRTRVRVGPFVNKAEAEKAAGRIKSLDLSASILTL